MTAVMQKLPNLKRMKALLALDRLSAPVQSDVLSDGSLALRYDIPIHRPVQLAEGVIVRQESVLQAFRDAIPGQTSSELLTSDGDKVSATVSVEADGAGVVELEKSRVRFEYGGLIAEDSAYRRSLLESYLSRNTLATRHVNELSQAIELPLSNEKFLRTATLMGTSLEKFSSRLQKKLKTGQVGESDLLPMDLRHWDHLTAPWVSSTTLAEFIDKELTDERALRLGRNARYAMTSISFTFATHALVPLDMLRKLEPDQVHGIVEDLIEADDHLTLAGAFEICVDWFGRDKRFEALGERLLDRLYGDLDRLQNACTIFAAAFIVALARLAVQQPLQEKPAYWRRLAAVAQASLVVRSAGVIETEQDDLVPWALRMCGKAYLASACLDARTEPRWQADWIMPNFLVADVFGRSSGVVSSLPTETVPPGWTSRLETARQKLREKKIETLMTFPSIAESARRDNRPAQGDLGPLAEHYQNFSSELSVLGLSFAADLLVRIPSGADCESDAADAEDSQRAFRYG